MGHLSHEASYESCFTSRRSPPPTRLFTRLPWLNHVALAGLTAGQYQAPTFEFLIADAPPCFPVSPSNFKNFPFLLSGQGTHTISGAALTVGPLLPFPPSTP
jgi:hypothetical protein